MNQQRPSNGNFGQFINGPGITSGGIGGQGVAMGGAGGPIAASPIPPPVPSRVPVSSMGYQSYGNGLAGGYGIGSSLGYRGLGMGGGYGGYGGYGSGYGSYGSYGNYGRYGNTYSSYQSPGYNQLGNPSGDAENRFVQFAEESSRPAFQSIESIVNTFSSVAIMMESTFFAMTSSFRAILSVAENVGRVRNMFGELLNTFALVRMLKWFYRRITYTLGLNPDDPNTEQVWRKTATEVMNGERTGPSTWPIFIFISMLIAIPYMINKLVNNVRKQVVVNDNNPKEWFRYNEPVYSAVVLYDFAGVSSEELKVKAGQKIWLAPQTMQSKNLSGWSTATDSINVGLLPSNYIRIIGELKKKSESTDLTHNNNLSENARSTKGDDNDDSPRKAEISSSGLDKVSDESSETLFQ